MQNEFPHTVPAYMRPKRSYTTGPADGLALSSSWFIRRRKSEVGLLSATRDRGRFLSFFLRSSWAVRVLLILGALITWPRLALLVPFAVILY